MKKIIISSILTLLVSLQLSAQWAIGFPNFDRFGNGSTGPGISQWRSFGIGDFSTFGAHPQSALHINQFFLLNSPSFNPGELFRTDCNSANTSAWRMFTGTGPLVSVERFALFVPALSPHVTLQASTGDFFFRTANPASVTQERIHITQGNGNQIGVLQPNATKVNISYGAGYTPIANPVAMLNLGFDPPNGPIGGQRTWMDVGTFACASSDNMYIGLKNEDPNGNFAPGQADRMDAVINWGDNIPPTPFGPDNFRFIFTNVQNPATATGASSTNGLETMRITPLNNNIAYTGIGGDPQINLYSSGTNIPQNTLEINSPAPANALALAANTSTGYLSAGLNGGTGRSGLRFTDLTSNSAPSTAPSTKVLSVNADGDVILVPGGGGGPGFSFFPCGIPNVSDQLPSSSWWEMSNNNFVFSGNLGGSSVNNVGIGTNCAPSAKLDILQISTTPGSIAEHIKNSDVDGTGIFIEVTGNGGAGSHFGINGLVSGSAINQGDVFTSVGGTNTWGGIFKGQTATDDNYGVQASGTGGTHFTIGVEGDAAGNTGAAGLSFGGRFQAISFSGDNYGIKAIAQNASGTNYGVYGAAPISNGWAGWFQGNVNFAGQVFGSQFAWASDQNLKTNIDSLTGAMAIIEQLKPKTFDYDQSVHPEMHLSSAHQIGLIAQDVEPVVNYLVDETTFPAQYDTLGNMTSAAFNYKTLNYNAFIAILIRGMQEQERKIDSLQNQINSCCSMNARTANNNVNQSDVTLSNSESVVLDQNVPNPFAEQTTITYNLPSSTKKAQMMFYDGQGKLIKVVELTGTGKGQLNVFADDLSNGIYSYALVVDGQVSDTKRMVKTN